ncbi:MAG: 2-C-methyl-D-erythritol 4-phosphate cytidylyltransferase [Parabacteroides sp.]|nr:2-C-methyl-D-erythritol 4-phosphate cytidylyltransferase [Parabacteroides sp.]
MILFAGGTGTRMKSTDIPKQFIKIDGEPIIIRTLKNFAIHKEVGRIIIVCLEAWIGYLEDLLEQYHLREKVFSVIPGGRSGYESIHNGLLKVSETAAEDDIVLVCDGVRPVVSGELISNCIMYTKKYKTAVPVVPSIDSVLYSEDGISCSRSMPRKAMYITQAPQGYLFRKLKWAHEEAERRGIKDPMSSSELLIELGDEIHLFIGERDNIKVTTPEDLDTLRSYYYYSRYKQFARETLEYGF